MLQKILSHIMDLPCPLAINEARKKLQGTYLKINKEIYYLNEINDHSILVTDPKTDFTLVLDGDSIKSMEVFLPESGVYSDGKYFMVLIKKPIRQWKKSFSWDFYSIVKNTYNQNNPTNLTFDILKKENLISSSFWILKETIFYLKFPIGKVSKDKIILSSDIFEYEINLWSKETNNTLEICYDKN